MSRLFLRLMTVLSMTVAASHALAQSDEAVFWQSISSSSDGAEFCAYLEAFPNGKFVALAKLRAKKLGASCGGGASPSATVAKPAAPKPATNPLPNYSIRVSPEEMKRTHDALLVTEPKLVGFPDAFPQSRIKPCFDCADILLVCRSASVAGAHQLKDLSIAVLDYETAKSGFIWLKDQSNSVFESDPQKIVSAVSNGGADCAAFGGGPLRYGEHYREALLDGLRDRMRSQAQPSVAKRAPVKRPKEGRFWSYEPYTDASKGITGRIVYRSAFFKEVEGRASYIDIKNDEQGGPRLYWVIRYQPRHSFGAGYLDHDVNVWLADHSTVDGRDAFSPETLFMMRDAGKCDYKNVNFCGVKCAVEPDQFVWRNLGDCRTLELPWFEFRAEMNESKWSELLKGANKRTSLWVTAGEFVGISLTDGLAETICEHVKGAQQYCGDVGNAAPASSTVASGAAIDPLDESRYVLKNANVRAAPSTNGAKLFVMNKGEQVQVTGKVQGQSWYQIKLGGSDRGYIFGTLLGDQQSGGPSVASVAPAPSAPAPSSPAPSSAGNSNLPSIDEANGPLCDFFGEGNGWKLYAGFLNVAVTSMDEREKFRVHNGFEANGVGLSFSEDDESGKEISIDLFNVEKNGEVYYDRFEAIGGGDIEYKIIDAELSLSAGGEATTVSATTTVFEFSVGGSGSHADFDLPVAWMMEKLRAGHEIAIDVFLQGSRAVSMTLDTSGFIDAFRHVNRARSKMVSNRANGRCGFGAGRPSASNGLLVCTEVGSRSAGYFKDARFAVIPGKWAKTAKEHADASPNEVDVIDISIPVYDIVDQVGYFPVDGVAFYDRNIRVRENPNGGGPLIIGEFVDSNMFKTMTDKFAPNNFRCELIAEVRTCPHPKYSWASEPCQ